MRNKKTTGTGFTLMELMIVVAVIGIISAVAFPSYQKSVMKSRRAEGKALLLDAANRQERRFGDDNKYTESMTVLGYAADPAISENGHYSMDSASTNATTRLDFTLTADTAGVQTVDTACATMSITNLGVKTSTGGGNCW